MSGEGKPTESVERSTAMLNAATDGEVTAGRLVGVQAAIGIGYGVLAIAEAAARIADALEQGIASRRERGDWP